MFSLGEQVLGGVVVDQDGHVRDVLADRAGEVVQGLRDGLTEGHASSISAGSG